MTNSFEFNGKSFKITKINAIEQFHIARRMTPILADIVSAVDTKTAKKVMEQQLSAEEQFDIFAKIASPVMTGLSKLSNEDSEFVLYGLLSSVEVKQSTGNWAYVSTKSMLMMQDLDLSVLLNIAGRAFMFNLSGFFSALPQK